MKFFGISSKLRKFIKETMKLLTYIVTIGPMMTHAFKGRKWLETRRQTSTQPLEYSSQYVIRQLLLEVKSMILYKSLQLIGYAVT